MTPNKPGHRALHGTCRCEAVRFSVEDRFEYALNCHCSLCRRATGAAFKPFAGVERAALQVLAGHDALQLFGQDQNHDARCKACGSFLYSVVREGTYVHVALGALIDAPSLRPTAHIFVGSKAPWHEITDGLPQHQAFP